MSSIRPGGEGEPPADPTPADAPPAHRTAAGTPPTPGAQPGSRVVLYGALAAVGAVAAAIVAILAVALGSLSSAHEHAPIESIFQDDQLLVYSPSPTVKRTLDTLRQLGVDRIRITVLWQAIAPDATSTEKPNGFDPSDPAAYPATAWAPFDRIVSMARAEGIGVNFNVTAPGPLWAM